MKCEHVEELLSLYIDNLTGDKENKAIKEHLDHCPKCQMEHGAFLSLRQTLRDLPVPPVPDKFMQDFRARLDQEQTRLIDFRKDRVSLSRKPGWISWMAATAASVALLAGVYMSSFLPSGSQMVAHFDQTEPSAMTAEQIIDRMGIAPVEDQTPPVNVAPFAADNLENYSSEYYNYSTASNDNSEDSATIQSADSSSSDSTSNPSAESSSTDNANDSASISTVASTDNYVAQHMYSSNTVADIAGALQSIENLAKKEGLAYELVGAQESTTMTVASAQDNQSIVMQVPPDQVDKVLQSLANTGISNPVLNEVNYTEEYDDVNKKLDSVQDSIESMEQQQNLDKEQELVLEKLKKDEAALLEQQELIESETSQVTIEVNFNTAVNP